MLWMALLSVLTQKLIKLGSLKCHLERTFKFSSFYSQKKISFIKRGQSSVSIHGNACVLF